MKSLVKRVVDELIREIGVAVKQINRELSPSNVVVKEYVRNRQIRCALKLTIYGRPNAYSELPAAIAMYSFPSTANAIGEAYTAPPI
jgi:hypothetical protein